jgi:endonuclease/exonuclease/phosphatase (EEP) superfamily protein YafD
VLIAAALVTAFFALSTALPFLPVAHGIVRVGDFPRQQVMWIALALVAAILAFQPDGTGWDVIAVVLVAVVAVQAWHVVPFTPLVRRQSVDARPDEKGEALRLLACNVKMSNRNYAGLTAVLEREDPDLIVLMEVDRAWADALATFLADYRTVVDKALENSYGMILASKFELSDTEVEYLLTEGVPSIVTTVTMPEGSVFRLYSIHPEPPVPSRGTEGRDGETALVALRVRDETLPVLVTGDLNDVAWSGTTRRFRRISGLLDPRIGRKVFSTFDARYPLVRWPLDHLFHSAEFRLRDMRRLPPCGSDHFPVLFDMVLTPVEMAHSEPEEADGADIDRAKELVDEADKRDEDPIGTDWEK